MLHVPSVLCAAAKEEQRKLKEMEKARIAEERELRRLEAAREKERKAEERRRTMEEKKKWVRGGAGRKGREEAARWNMSHRGGLGEVGAGKGREEAARRKEGKGQVVVRMMWTAPERSRRSGRRASGGRQGESGKQGESGQAQKESGTLQEGGRRLRS